MFAAAFIDGKIHNTRVLLRRLNRRRALPQVTEAEAAIAALQARIPVTTELNRLRGLEGAAAHVLFGTVRHLLQEHWRFPGRRRRPPTDPLNVLLSYGYGVLFANLHTLAERQGLDVRLGHLHASDGRHPALISDLMEEFRAPLVDAVAINLLLNEHLRPEDFVWQGDAAQPCRLTDDARKRYLAALQARLRSSVMHPRAGMRLDWQRLLQYQVWHYARVVMRDEAVYHPYRSK
jgi:CRISPR-associated protein Cas1